MASSFPIPLTALPVGTQRFGPVSVPDADTFAVLTVDRTVTKGGTPGFAGQPAATQARISVEQSGDGGATWAELAAGTIIGGTLPAALGGQPADQVNSTVGVRLWPGTSRQGRAAVVVSGAAVAVSGTLITS